MSAAFEMPDVSDEDLLDLEERLRTAQRDRSIDGLKVFGFGEVSIAVGWPTDEPRFVAKRMLPMSTARHVEEPLEGIRRFTKTLEKRGGSVLPYETRQIRRPDDQYVGYVVQPIVPTANLAETVLATEDPTDFHPVLVAIRDFVTTCIDDDMTLDAQVPNFVWKDGAVHLLDITSPASFDQQDNLVYPNMHLTKQLVPAVLRPVLARASSDVFRLYRGEKNALTQIAVFLHRVDAAAWVEPALATFNEVLDEPIDIDEVTKRWQQNVKDFPRIKNLVKMQRAWQETVRRRPFEVLITDSFNGEVL